MNKKNAVEEIAQEYWELSKAWNGDIVYAKNMTMGELITKVTNLAGKAMTINWRLEDFAAKLLQRVINQKRCRKTRGPNNVVTLYKPPMRVGPDAITAEGMLLDFKYKYLSQSGTT